METGKTDKDTIYSNMQRYAPSRERTDREKTVNKKARVNAMQYSPVSVLC